MRKICPESRKRMGGLTKFKPIHGLRNTVEYRIWQDMLNRCRNKKVHSYPHYGGRGIIVCAEWNDFSNFYRDMGKRLDGMSIDRIDVNGNYCKENCHWIPKADQQKNTTSNKNITFNGKTQCLAVWAREIGIRRDTLALRIKRGWSLERALCV